MMVRLYYSERSGNCRKVHLALLEVAADYQLVHVDLLAGEQKRAEYLALNPNGKVPTLVDGETVLWESNAILWYLAEKYPATGLVPEDRLERARLQQLLFWQATELTPAVRALARHAGPESRAAALDLFAVLAGLLAGRGVLVGGGVTIADLAMGPYVERALELGVPLPEAAQPWLTAMRARPSWQKVFGAPGSR